MVKGFGGRYRSAETLFYLLIELVDSRHYIPKGKLMSDKKTEQKDVIAYRKSCKAKGTGLSHYILMDKNKKAK